MYLENLKIIFIFFLTDFFKKFKLEKETRTWEIDLQERGIDFKDKQMKRRKERFLRFLRFLFFQIYSKRFFLLVFLFLFSFLQGEFKNRAEAKDLYQRIGVGFINGVFDDFGGIATRYYPSPSWGIAGILGIDTLKNQSKFSFIGKFYRILFKEENMNFYSGFGTGVISRGEKKIEGRKTEDASTGYYLSGYIGGEFFLPGLENLGFSFEVTISIDNLYDEVRFLTMGQGPIQAGIIFYF